MAVGRWVTVTMVMLSLTMVMPFIWHTKLQPASPADPAEGPKRNVIEEQMQRVIRSLGQANNRMEEIDIRKQRQTKDVVIQEMAAVIQNNTLPNYFLFKPAVDGLTSYQQGALVFLHHPRAAGSALTACLDDISHNRSLAASPVMDSDERLRWATERETDGETARENCDRFAVHRGRFAFGMCSDISRKCSHFTLLREPMSRAVSSFRYCQTAYGDEMCRVVNANKLTLRDWIIHEGSVLFRQLLFQPSWCRHNGENLTGSVPTNHSYPYGSSEQHRKSAADPDHIPCWYKHKLKFDEIPRDLKNHLLDYVVNNLDRWFAAIGLYEELVPSLKMFEHVYNLPFTQCLNFKSSTPNNAEIFDNRSNRKKTRLNSETNDLDNDPEYLKYDYGIQRALEADMKIYREAKKLFRIQRQNLFNKISR